MNIVIAVFFMTDDVITVGVAPGTPAPTSPSSLSVTSISLSLVYSGPSATLVSVGSGVRWLGSGIACPLARLQPDEAGNVIKQVCPQLSNNINLGRVALTLWTTFSLNYRLLLTKVAMLRQEYAPSAI